MSQVNMILQNETKCWHEIVTLVFHSEMNICFRFILYALAEITLNRDVCVQIFTITLNQNIVLFAILLTWPKF